VLAPLVAALFAGGSRDAILERLASLPNVLVPARTDVVPPLARAASNDLPAYAAIWTPKASLPDMFLVEAERGCARSCAFCVMRRQEDCGMRLVPAQRILALVPDAAPRVGLVGAGVSDHPEIASIVRALVDAKKEVGLSSLRADRLNDELVALLVRGGNRTLTVAADGASERLRVMLDKKIRAEHLLRAAELARAHGVPRLKLYVMVGVPDETDADLDELTALLADMRARLGGRSVLAVGISVFVPKPGTPLADAPFVGVREAERRVRRVGHALAKIATVAAASGRWAWVEHLIAHGSEATGRTLLAAWRQGGGYAAIKKAMGGAS